MHYALLTRKSAQEVIKPEKGDHLAIRTVGEYLKHWGTKPHLKSRNFLAQTSSSKLALPFLSKVIAFSHDDDLKEEAGTLIESIQHVANPGEAKK